MIYVLLKIGASWGTEKLIKTFGIIGICFWLGNIFLVYINLEARIEIEQEMYNAKLNELGLINELEKEQNKNKAKKAKANKKKKIVLPKVIQHEEIDIEMVEELPSYVKQSYKN